MQWIAARAFKFALSLPTAPVSWFLSGISWLPLFHCVYLRRIYNRKSSLCRLKVGQSGPKRQCRRRRESICNTNVYQFIVNQTYSEADTERVWLLSFISRPWESSTLQRGFHQQHFEAFSLLFGHLTNSISTCEGKKHSLTQTWGRKSSDTTSDKLPSCKQAFTWCVRAFCSLVLASCNSAIL